MCVPCASPPPPQNLKCYLLNGTFYFWIHWILDMPATCDAMNEWMCGFNDLLAEHLKLLENQCVIEIIPNHEKGHRVLSTHTRALRTSILFLAFSVRAFGANVRAVVCVCVCSVPLQLRTGKLASRPTFAFDPISFFVCSVLRQQSLYQQRMKGIWKKIPTWVCAMCVRVYLCASASTVPLLSHIFTKTETKQQQRQRRRQQQKKHRNVKRKQRMKYTSTYSLAFIIGSFENWSSIHTCTQPANHPIRNEKNAKLNSTRHTANENLPLPLPTLALV